MRLLVIAVVGLACTQKPEAAPVQTDNVSLESIRMPRDTRVTALSGVVTKREGGAVLLDSGGANPIPLRFDASTKVTIDGQQATGAEIREGDIVRAAYRFDEAGEPLALEVVANSQDPAALARMQPAAPPQAEQARSAPISRPPPPAPPRLRR